MKKINIITKNSHFDAVILANGTYPQNEIALDILRNASIVICCDGAAIHYPGKPTAIVGDGDSLPDSYKSIYHDIIIHVSEQEDNDLTKATRYCIERSKDDNTIGNRKLSIAYLGATGEREDHTLGNIALIMRYAMRFGIEPTMITDHGYFTPCAKENSNEENIAIFESFPKQQISIFNFGCTKLEGTGFGWNPYAYEELWQGTLNEAEGKEVTLKGDGNFLVFSTFEPKK